MMNDDDMLSDHEAKQLLAGIMRELSSKYGRAKAIDLFNKAARDAGVAASVSEAEPEKES
jgi:hypothetical protein